MSNVKVYGFCDAGCRRRVPMYEEFLASAYKVKMPIEDDGYYYPKLGETIICKNANTTSGWGFNIEVGYNGADWKQFSIEENTPYDAFADGLKIRFLSNTLFPTDFDYVNGIQLMRADAYIETDEKRAWYFGNTASDTVYTDEDLVCVRIGPLTDCYHINEDAKILVEGASAYEVALANGFEGTEQEWLDSLKGEDGKDGEKGDTINIVQSCGDSPNAVMSQKSVTESIGATESLIVVECELHNKKVINGVGSIIDSTSYEAYITDYVEVTAGEKISISCNANWSNRLYAFYNESKAVVTLGEEAAASSTRTYIEKNVLVPEGAKYVVVSGGHIIKPIIKRREIHKINCDIYQFKIVNSVGSIIDSTSYEAYITDYVEVVEGKTYKISGSANWGNSIYAFYDGLKMFVLGGAKANPGSDRTWIDENVIIPYGCKYIIVSGTTNALPAISSNEISYEIAKKWHGKKWACVGDSLTEKNLRTTKNYHDYIAESTGIDVINMGISGTGYKRRFENNEAFYQRISSVPPMVDVVTIFGSGNDLYLYGEVLGEATDTGTDTLCGCINTTIDNLYAILPTVQLGIVTPTPWQDYSPSNADNIMERYSNKIVEICKLRGIPCLDLYHCSGLRPWEESFREAAYSKDDGGGTHPDEKGHKIIAPRFKAFLEELLL